MMKRSLKTQLIATTLILCFSLGANGQSMAGKVYHNPNIMRDLMKEAMQKMDQKADSIKMEAIAKKEKEKGRKLTAEEKKEVEKELKEKMKEAEEMANGAMKMAITFTFKDETNAVMGQKMTIDEELLKKAGIGWAKRKAMKAALALAPENEKCTYVREGNLIIVSEGKDKDTLTLSNDGTKLYGEMEKGKNFILTLQK